MTLQNKTLHRYRQFFPKDNLRQVSERTGIQLTRVFRLMNGKTMKVGELEAFENAIAKMISDTPNISRLSSIVDEASALLTNEELGRMAEYFERRVANKRYSRTYISANFNDASIA